MRSSISAGLLAYALVRIRFSRARGVAIAVATCMVAAGSCPASPTEYEVKSAFIYNFAKFLEWPANAFASADSPIIIGIIGDDPFGGLLQQTVRGKTAAGRRIEVKHFDKVRDCQLCHILFVSASERGRLSKILDRLKGSSVLTVGETAGFVRQGGIIGFVMDDNKVGFEVNVGAAKQAGLKISSKLLKLAKDTRE